MWWVVLYDVQKGIANVGVTAPFILKYSFWNP